VFLQTGCIEKVMKYMKNNIKDGNVIFAGLLFLLNAAIETKALALIVSNSGVPLTIKVLEYHSSERLIMDMNARLMYVLASDDDEPLAKKDVLASIVKLMSNHSQWKIPNLFYLKTLNLIAAGDPSTIAPLKKLSPLLTIVSLLSGKRIP
jgi:hypothetical protein